MNQENGSSGGITNYHITFCMFWITIVIIGLIYHISSKNEEGRQVDSNYVKLDIELQLF